ncbi:MAG: tetratricopeptide repeat protein [Pelodictyon phaeoclathratiforme]|nr:tetratricopeptide repeat protein [Pelodictyon phaeoclathratiforme]
MKHRIPKKEKSKQLGGFRVEHQTETSDPSDAPVARLQAALTFHQQGRLDEAEAVYREILVTEPDQFDAFRLLAIIAAQRKQFHEAIALFERAFEINSEHANSLNNYGIVLCEVKRYNDAVLSFDKAIALNPDYGEAALNREAVLKILKRYDEVVLSCGLAFKGNNAAVCSDYGNVLQELSRYEESLLYYDRALALEPDYVAAYFNRGLALKKLKRYDEAVLSYDKAIALEPDYAEAHSNRGNALTELKRYHDAVLSYDRALALKPDYAKAHANRGVALQELKQYDEAVLSYGRALACKPDYDFLFAEQLFLSVRICDWRSFEHQVFLLREKISRHENVSTPFPVLALVDSPLLQQEAARIYVNAKHVINAPLPLIAKRERHEKIRIGYYSADFQNHATTYLMAELFERHDRRRFELTAFSFGPDKQDEMRTRVACAFDRFIDVRTRSDREVALLSRELEIDIAVDLKGFTTDSRTGIFALRAAPIQVSYLGYPGTMGMDSMDYLIADQTLIPVYSRQYYTEKIVFLPDSYQVNDTKRTIAEKDFTRKECGLPEKGFVFCCFNNNYKITPFVFDSWMRILRQVEGSVFWIFEDNPKAAENLRKEATRRGVDSNRLIFSKRIPLAEHLARHRLADLFLDTHPCNAHTTASDALWAGLPLLTLAGETFVARVAASLLNAIQLPELITCTQEEYEALAIELATNPDRLKLIRLKLEKNRLTTPLFDTERFTHHLEEAYGVMYERYQDGLLPEHIVSLPSAEERKELLTMALESSGERHGQKAALVCDAASDHASRFPEALTLHQQGRINEAEALYREILCANPKHFDALQLLATVAAQKRNFSEAAALFEQAFAINSDCPELLNNWGNTLKELKRYDEALHCFDRATELNPYYVEAYYNRGITLKELQRYDEALLSYDAVIALKPDYPEVYVNRGNVLKELLRCDEALLSYNSALVLKPDYTQAYFNQALALQHLKQYEEAVLSYDKAILLNPEYVAAYSNRGSALKELKRYDEALSNYGEAIARNPQFAEAYVNRGNALTDLKRYQDALLDYDRAIAVKLDYAIAYFNRGVIQQKLKLYEDAVLSYDNAYTFEPTFDFLYGLRLYARMQICDWSIFYNNVRELREKIGRCEKVSIPFPVIALLDSLVLQKEVAKLYVQEKYPANHELPVMVNYPQHERIRIGYYSADFHNHATTYLMAELFERHDRSRFELTAFSFGPDKQDEMRARVASAFDYFIDVRTRSDREVALLSRELEIDIAIDLKGFTQDSRPGIFALRAAPIQVSYLGFPGTMGAGYIDYLIADRTLIPERSQYGYTEKIVYLPDSYQINDTKRLIAKKLFTRKELGLPEIGFVFCCFNNNYKITPLIFDGWMRILRQVEGSVLWLFEDTQRAAQNLRREAIEKGVDAERLIFAKRMPLAEHLARHRIADLFLDTFPCNAHTTASDALWAGLPLLTLAGETFAARVAASLLNAIQLPELITFTQEKYEALAIELATNPEKLIAIRQKLEKNRLTTPLFDTERFTHHLEEAYGVMYERYQEGLPPGHIVSLPSAEGSEPLLTMAFALPKARSEQDVSAVAETAARSGPAYFATLQSALALHQQGCLDDAEVLYREVVHSNPDYFEAVQLLATVAAQKQSFHEALELFDHALAIKPDHPITLNNRGNTLIALKRYGDALSSYERAFLLKPDYAEAFYNRALALQELERHEEAVSSYEKAICIKPDYAEAYYKRGVALQRLQRYDDALLCYDKVIALKPDYADAHYSRGLALQELQRYDEALISYDAVIALKPDYPLVYGICLHMRMHSCDWANFDHYLSVIIEKIECHKYVAPPFIFFASVDSLSLQKKVSTIFMQGIFPANHELPLIERHSRHERIRIGYYSADFHNHATANLMAELFERHDRSRFELTAFSFGADAQDEMRRRVATAFDRFIDVRTQSDREVALLSRELEIDIAIDLKGVTQYARPGIFTLRAAPIQVSYLGFPATMGAEYIDYLIADRTLIPESSRYGYTEKIVYLPDSYQVNDTKRLIAERVFTRKECGLPEKGFVFCCFNNNYKITPVTFDGWMRILKRVEGSVLWLLGGNPKAVENLRKESTERGVDAERLIFAKRMPLAEHLARHRIADLFLDTFPCNAHTTASDALWAGLPLLTLAGETFAARVAASLLNAIQLPELITFTQEKYEALAIELATNPEKLIAIRQKLEKNRLTTPLFDTERFTHHLEEAYGVIYERYQEGLPPGHIVSLPSAEGRKELLMKGTVPGVRAEQDVSVASETTAQYRPAHSTRLHSALALHQQGCLDDAEVLYRKILREDPEHFDALQLLATIAAQKKNFSEAVELFDQAFTINSNHPNSLNNWGNALKELKRYDEAISSYDKAVTIKADYAEAYVNRGIVFEELKLYDMALSSYDKAFAVNAGYDFLPGMRFAIRMLFCDWVDFDNHVSLLREKIGHHERVSSPFTLFAISDSLSQQKEAALIYVDAKQALDHLLPVITKCLRHDKIRVAYYSADFHNHATAYLMAELFERHDRSNFEFTAFSFGADAQDEMRRRVATAFDRFIDVRTQSDREVALLSRELEIDIAIDLKGFTQHSRPGIFALRAAPIQVSYLGYPGTMGAEYIDYLIADRTLIPESCWYGYTEKIVYLPDSYQVNDTKRLIAERVFTRKELGLPEIGFVFCCFNNNYKITPVTFEGWMRILKRVEGSVLWLLEDNPKAAANLRKEATERGVDAERLIFAKRMPLAEHLARHRIADLFLDTFPCNAHTTASDALWAGLPLLTLAGETFAARVAASLLNAIQLPELITFTQEKYEALAIELATNPEKLIAIRQKLEKNRLTTPLFDTERFTHHLEEAYGVMYERYQEGLPPGHIVSLPSAEGSEPLLTMAFALPKARSEQDVSAVAETAARSGPAYFATLQSALALHQQGCLDDAEVLYREVVHSNPDYFEAVQLLATVAAQKQSFHEALELFDHALAIKPDHPITLNNRGNTLIALKRYGDALSSYERAFLLKPDYAEAFYNRALALQELERHEEAVSSYEKAICIKPDYAEAYYKRGVALQRLQRYDDALLCYDKVIALKPDYADAHYSRGLALQELQRYDEALSNYGEAIARNPQFAEAYVNRGNALTDLKRYQDALLDYDRAIAVKLDYAIAYFNRGVIQQKLKLYEDAVLSYDNAYTFEPTFDFLYGLRLYARMQICDWSIFYNNVRELREKIGRCEKVSIPFPVIALLDSLVLQKEVAKLYVQEKYPANHELPVMVTYPQHERIRIGYYSADFHNHATANLMAELFERHDRSRFELTAFSFGPEVQDEMRARVAIAFDRFIEVRTLSDREVALLSRELEIDIAIDLKGVTQYARPGMFALRAAPIQVSYLGFPATMGAEYIDYLIADRTLIPESSRYGYTEKIVYLPDSYQVNDTKRLIAERVFTRKECGLPEKGFVFCCFNNNYKITPVTFDGWMRILKRVEGSVLWLLGGNPKAVENLRKESTERGVDAERLIFAKRMPLAEHLARHRIADLFLDTFPCNAHTTASDALWAGLPLLTLAGETFAARVAASLLNAIQLPELITFTQEKYEALAIELATNPEKLIAIRQKLEKNRLTTPLFDTERFTHHLEEAYGVMYERYQEGLPPGHIVSLPSAEGRKESLMKGTVPGVRAEQDVSVASETAAQYRPAHSIRLHSALALHQQGCLDDAEVLYREILRANPEHFDALRLLATVAAQRKNFPEAEELFDQALKINPAHATVWNNRGIALQELKRYDEALQCYDNALERKADYAAAFFYRGLVLTKLHRYDEAVLSYNRALILKPDYAAACYNLGNTLQKLNRYDEALVCYDKVLVIKPGDAEACSNRGITLKELQRYDEAVLSYEKALALRPDYADAYYNLGNVLQDLKRYREALDNYDKVLAIRPGDAHVYSNRGIALQELKRYDEALVSYEKALALKPDYAKAYSNRGSVLQALNRNDEALLSYERAIAIKQDYAEAYRNRGVVLKELKRYDEALLSYERAIAFKPDSADGYFNLGIALRELKRYDEALINFDKTLFINPGYEFLFGVRLYTMMHICDWSTFKHHVSQLREKLERHEKASTPFPLLALIGSLLLQKQVSSDYVQEKYSANPELPLLVKRSRHDKIRIGYYSADFHNHATAYLMAELFEMHDRSRFEIIAFSFGPDRQDEMRKRVAIAFDCFVDVRTQSDREVALLSRELEIDIAVDLKGFTQDSRCGIFALRAAPIQVSYLGYPGTMGADYIDYLIADPTLIPESCRYGYTEKIAYLPDSYQVNDTKRTIAERVFTRKECGLPEKGFIFCCFNNNYKITPVTFDGWMRLLRQVEGSVLWLLEDNVTAADNLRKEAIKRGIDAARIVFAQRMPLAEHLARQRLGYLFLDTFPCNAHTTASDALWVGLPVLTLAGESFASRVAASLLNAMQLPELITSTQEEYEALAIDVATNPEKLGNIRRKLEQNRLTTPLFDTELFTRNIEAAYDAMYERYQRGFLPDHIKIA